MGPFMQSSVIRMLFGGIFPDRFKVARVTPIYKEGDKQEAQNYRPISVLPVYLNIFEASINNRLCNYLSRNRIIHRNQFGFQKKTLILRRQLSIYSIRSLRTWRQRKLHAAFLFT
jgi:hypothetical protein